MYGAALYGGAEFAGNIAELAPPDLPAPVFSSAGRLADGTVAVGNQEEIRFYFAARELTVAEEEHFFDPGRPAGQALPPDVGVDPGEAFLEYQEPGREPSTLPAVRDAEGEFHTIIEVPMFGKGVWSYRGRGVQEGAPIATTPARMFTAVRAF